MIMDYWARKIMSYDHVTDTCNYLTVHLQVLMLQQTRNKEILQHLIWNYLHCIEIVVKKN